MNRSEPSTILVSGDTHGDPQHALYIFQTAFESGAQAIVHTGDFGYWEHMPGGDAFLDFCSHLATENDLPLYWVDGNHENHTWLRRIYGPGGSKHKPTPEGFWEIRPGVYYIPRGTRWVWSEVHLMGLGGACSVDKFDRLKAERKNYTDHIYANNQRVKAGSPTRPYDPEKWQRWWREEELTDEDVARALADPTPIDILFTHDKPRGSNPSWNRKDILECLPNQDKIQTVVNSLHPKLLVHGHLHHRYRDDIPAGNDGQHCRVEGLHCNVSARFDDPDKNPETSWILVQLVQEEEPG